MKQVIIKIMGIGYYNINQVKVTIYDECNYIVYKGFTCNGIIKVNLKKNKLYKLMTNYYGEYLIQNFIVNNNYKEYIFKFNHCIFTNNNYDENNITFLLTDYNYDNLPIERGNLILNG